MLETSKDLLFVVLALCVLWLTIFMSWLMYYVISIVRDAERIVRLVKSAAVKIDDIAQGIQDRLDKSAASFSLVAHALREVVTWAIEQKISEKAEGSRVRKGKK